MKKLKIIIQNVSDELLIITLFFKKKLCYCYYIDISNLIIVKTLLYIVLYFIHYIFV